MRCKRNWVEGLGIVTLVGTIPAAGQVQTGSAFTYKGRLTEGSDRRSGYMTSLSAGSTRRAADPGQALATNGSACRSGVADVEYSGSS